MKNRIFRVKKGNSSIENGRRENRTGFELAFSRENSSWNKLIKKILQEEFPHKYVQYVLNSSLDFPHFLLLPIICSDCQNFKRQNSRTC